MGHVAKGTRPKAPFKPRRSRAKNPEDWREAVRLTLNKQRGGFRHKKNSQKSSWRNGRDGFVITGRDNEPSKNTLDALEKRSKN